MRVLRLRPAGNRRNTLATSVAIGGGLVRTVAGVGLLNRPQALPRALGVDSVTAHRVAWITRMLAARELALGIGLLQAAVTRRPFGPWLLAESVSDAGDAAALLLAVRDRQVSTTRALGLVAFAASGVAGQLLARSRLRGQVGNGIDDDGHSDAS